MSSLYNKGLHSLAGTRSEGLGIAAMKIAIAIVFLWIRFLKFQPYEADSITVFVANSQFMSFFYNHPHEYAHHLTKEGVLIPAQRAWQMANNTYGFSTGLGLLELFIGFTTLAGLFSRRIGMVGAVLSFLTPFVTLSFLVTTPEAWVPALGDAQHGFPYLSGAGRLVIKDVCILAGAWLVMVHTARELVLESERASRWTAIENRVSQRSDSPAVVNHQQAEFLPAAAAQSNPKWPSTQPHTTPNDFKPQL